MDPVRLLMSPHISSKSKMIINLKISINPKEIMEANRVIQQEVNLQTNRKKETKIKPMAMKNQIIQMLILMMVTAKIPNLIQVLIIMLITLPQW
jgi:hypothetical protein